MTEMKHPAPLGTLQDDLNIIIAHAETACLYAEVTHNDQILTSSLVDLKLDLHSLSERLKAIAIAPSVNVEERTNGS
mgnify:CR=1 FL=1